MRAGARVGRGLLEAPTTLSLPACGVVGAAAAGVVHPKLHGSQELVRTRLRIGFFPAFRRIHSLSVRVVCHLHSNLSGQLIS